MEPGNAAAFIIPGGIPQILMTRSGLWQKWLQTMGFPPGEQYMALQKRLSGYGPIITQTLFIVGWN